MKKAWSLRCSTLSEEEKTAFESRACNGLADYVDKLEAACQRYRDESSLFLILDWFEPIFTAVDLFVPPASTAIQAYPNPGSLVLGGIVAVLQATSRLREYQRLTLQLLAKMGRTARIVTKYEKELYNDEPSVQEALVVVYGDILVFCQKACSFLADKNHFNARVKGLRLTLISNFNSRLGKEVEDFETHMEDLEARARFCDRKRLKDVLENQEALRRDVVAGAGASVQHLEQHHNILVDLWKLDQDIRKREVNTSRGLMFG